MKSTLPLFLVAALASAAAASGERSIAFGVETMGSWGEIIVVGSDSLALAPAAEAGLRRFARVDSLMSNWTDDSELARLNREGARGCEPHPEVGSLLTLALEISQSSEGAFDCTVEPLVRLWGFLGGTPALPEPAAIAALLPEVGSGRVHYDAERRWLTLASDRTRLDFGGIAKGHGVDSAVEALRARGVEDALVNLSGNMRGIGAPPGRSHWIVGLRDPTNGIDYFATLRLDGEAVATSGNYEQFVARDGQRYGHILDPRTGWPASGLLQATVLAASAAEADAWATALIVLGPDRAPAVLAEHPELLAVLVQRAATGGTVARIDARLEGRVVLREAAAGTFTIESF